MQPFLLILASLALLLALSPLLRQVISKAEQSYKLRRWRRTLTRGMTVIADNGHSPVRGVIVHITPTSVTIVTATGRKAAYGHNCIYPLHHHF